MAILAVDRETARKDPGFKSYLVGTDIIYKGSMVTFGTDGLVVAGQATAGHKFAGVADEQVDNAAAATKEIRLWTEGLFKLAATSITQAMVGQMMYLQDDQTFDDVPAAVVIPCGVLVEVVSATEGWIDIGRAGAVAADLKSITLDGKSYATISLAMAAAGAGDIIVLGPGTYLEDVTWSDANNVQLVALIPGTVTIEAVTAFAVKVDPAAASGTWSFYLRGINLSHGTGLKGLWINNTTVAKRINAMLYDVDIESETETDAAIDVDRAGTSAHSIRLYAVGHGNTIEGLVDYITESTDDRVRFWGYRLVGGLTVTGAIVMEVTLVCCGVKTSGFTVNATNVWNKIACYEETDANPNVHTATVDAVEQ